MCACGKPIPKKMMKHFREMNSELQFWIKANKPNAQEVLDFMEIQHNKHFNEDNPTRQSHKH